MGAWDGRAPPMRAWLLLFAFFPAVLAREPFPTNEEPQDLDCDQYPGGEDCAPYVDGVLYESNLTVALVIFVLSFLMICISR